MFTIKHINIGGDENLYQSKTVHFEPRRGYPEEHPVKHVPAYVHLDDTQLTGGTIFVMSENGKTVARYDLGASPVPHLGTVNEPKTWRDTETPRDPAFAQPQTVSVAGDDYSARVA